MIGQLREIWDSWLVEVVRCGWHDNASRHSEMRLWVFLEMIGWSVTHEEVVGEEVVLGSQGRRSDLAVLLVVV